jgi:hypothetical protein
MGNPHNIAAPPSCKHSAERHFTAEAQRIIRHFRAELLSGSFEAWTALRKLEACPFRS